MNDEDYRRLLSSVDGVDDDVPPDFADNLWDDLRGTIGQGGSESRPLRYEAVDLVDASADRHDRRSSFAGPWLGRAAAAVLLVVGVTGLVVMNRDPAPRQSDQPVATVPGTTAPTLPPVLDDPTEACRRFEVAGPLAELSRSLGDPETETATIDADLERAVVALDVYVRDLDAAAELTEPVVLPSDVAPLRRALDSLEQAQLEVETGDLDRAKRSVDAAISRLIEAPTPWC